MGYRTNSGRWANTLDVQLTTAAVVAGTGVLSGSTQEIGDRGTLRLNLVATASAAANTTVAVETSADGSTNWVAVASFAAVVANVTQRKVFTGLDRWVRLNATASTGTTTLAVSGEAL